MLPSNGHGHEALDPRVYSVVTKTWNYLQPPTTTYNHLQPSTTTSENLTTTYNHLKKFNNHLQPPQKHLKQGINVFNNNMSRTWNTRIEQNIHLPLKSYSLWSLVSSTMRLRKGSGFESKKKKKKRKRRKKKTTLQDSNPRPSVPKIWVFLRLTPLGHQRKAVWRHFRHTPTSQINK